MNLSGPQLQQIVGMVIARLLARRQQVARLSVAQLREAEIDRLLCGHATLAISLADTAFLSRLAAGEDSDPAVRHLNAALAVGAAVSISVHHRLLAAPAIGRLAALPIAVFDERGQQVHISRAQVLSYRHIAALSGGWLVAPPGALITPLARETALARGIKLVKQE